MNPGTGGKMEIENNDIVATSQPMTMDDIMISLLKITIDNASNITGDLSKITNNVQSGIGTIERLLMDKSLRQNFDSTFANLKEGSAMFRMLVDKAKKVGCCGVFRM
jgi:hypothetical protein